MHVFLQVREAIKMYAKLLRGAKMETLTTSDYPAYISKIACISKINQD